jgi:hypothetical protein
MILFLVNGVNECLKLSRATIKTAMIQSHFDVETAIV